jgi:diguanylate cyclase (GGDEF)-like protein
LTAIVTLLLGTERRQRVNLTRMSIAAAVYLFCLLLQWQAVWSGFTSSSTAAWFTLFLVLGVCGFYAAVRSGVSLRFAEPALTMPQMIFATISIALAYLINPHVRGALLVLVALVLVFGAFTLAPERCRQLGWIAAAVLASVMALGAWRAPDRFEPQIEVFYMLFTVIVLPTISILAGQLSQLRIDHQLQRRALRDAMQRLELVATHDELTGLPNRRYIHDWMTHELGRRSRSGAPMSVAIIDLDHFKRVNDTLGHAVGDQVLRVLTCAARAVLRDGDVLARWGGEEFLLVMPDTSIAAAQLMLDRLRAHIAQETTWVDCPLGRVTFSAGVTLQVPGQSLDVTAHRADGALYEAKRLGRDRVVTAAGAPSFPPCSGFANRAPVWSSTKRPEI